MCGFLSFKGLDSLRFMFLFSHRNVRHTRQHNKNQKSRVEKELKDKEQEMKDREREMKEKEQPDGEMNATEVKDEKSDPDGSRGRSAGDLDILDSSGCKFNVNSFKMVYVVNCESYLYKRTALKRAKEVRQHFEAR